MLVGASSAAVRAAKPGLVKNGKFAIVAAGGHYDGEEITMRKSVMVFCMVPATIMLIGGTLSASSRAQAMPLGEPSGLKSAIDQANVTQKVRCRRGSHGRGCYHVSPNARYGQYYAYRAYQQANPWRSDQPHPPYDPYYWGSAVMGGGR
jgi:hypothetical protein